MKNTEEKNTNGHDPQALDHQQGPRRISRQGKKIQRTVLYVA